MPLDLSAFRDAAAQLAAGIAAAEAEPEKEIVRDGAIQRFEYCYELAVKMLRRTLETAFGDAVDQMAFRDLLRTAAERGLIAAPERWFLYREQRNKTAHTYDAEVAAAVFAAARQFLPDAQSLLHALERFSH